MNQIVDFQTEAPEPNDERHYFECIGATLEPNRNYYQFTIDALNMMAEQYKQGKTLTVNHDKYRGIGLGETSDAVVQDNMLYIQAYIKRNLTFPEGALGSSGEFIDSIMDGFLKAVSVSVMMDSGLCSICNQNYNDYQVCRHIRGYEYIIGEGDNRKVVTCIVIIKRATVLELSLVQDGADEQAMIVRKAINLHADGIIDEDKLSDVRKQFGNISTANANGDPEKAIPNTNNNGGNADPEKPTQPASASSNPETTQPPTTVEPVVLNNNPIGDNTMTPEEIQQLQARNQELLTENAGLKTQLATAQSENATLSSGNNAITAENTALKAENSTLKTEKTTTAAEVTSLKTQLEAVNLQKESLEQTVEATKSAKTVSDNRISELEAEIAGNAILVEDGKAAREEVEAAYLEAYTKANVDCTIQDKERQADFAKTQTITKLKEYTETFEENAAMIYKAGRKTQEGSGDPNPNGNGNGGQRPKGVGYSS